MTERANDNIALHARLSNASRAIRDDIRRVFKEQPEYGKYLADLLDEAASALALGERAGGKDVD